MTEKFTTDDKLIIFEKVITFLSQKQGTYFDDPEYGSPLYKYIDRFITETTRDQIIKDLKESIRTYLPDIYPILNFEITPNYQSGFSIRLIYENTYVDISSKDISEFSRAFS